MRTEEELEIAFNNGDLSDSEMDSYLVGDDLTSDTAETADIKADEVEEGSLPAETDDKQEADEPEVKPEDEPVVLAKDGVHTIPYSELLAARDEEKRLTAENAVLSAKFAEQGDMLEKLNAAQKTDAEEGNTDATDDLMDGWAEDYPERAEEFKAMQDQVKALLEKVEGNETANAELSAQQSFDKEIAALNADYTTVKGDDAFWTWLDDQPKAVRDVRDSGDPQQIADTVKLYTDSQKPAAGGDTTGAAKDAVKKAIDSASKKSTVQSLSDIPGGSNPAVDELDAFSRLTDAQQLDKAMGMDSTAINALMNKIV